MHKLTSLLFASALLVACRGGDGNDPDARPNSDGPPNPDDATIYDIQNPDNRIPAGTTVNVRGVVVTAIDTYGMRVGNIWVQEPAGGPYSGVLVFGVDATVVQTLQLGDIVDIAGAAKSEFSLDTDLTGRKTTELEPGDSGTILLTRVSAGTPLVPEPVDANAIAALDDTGTRPTARDNAWEEWEGVLIEISDVTKIGDIGPIGTTDPTFEGFSLPGGLETDTSLAPFPAGLDGNVCLATITGIGDYFFNWKILARQTGELVPNGTNCPPPKVATVTSVQMGTSTGAVELQNVVVTAVTFNRSNLYVQDALTGAPYNGVLVYRGGSSVPDLPVEIEPGAIVNISGTVEEFMGFTEITGPSVTFVSAPAGLPTPVATDLATLNDDTLGEPYEGVYVTVTDASVSMVVATNPDFYFTLSQATESIVVDDDVYRATVTDGTCFASVSGIFAYNGFTSPIPAHVNLLPTLVTDLVPGGTCP